MSDSRCYLCGNDRSKHEIGCIEPLIVADVMSEVCGLVAERLGIIIGKSEKNDKVIGFLFRRGTEKELSKDPEAVTRFTIIDGQNAARITLQLLSSLETQLKEGDVTLIPRQEAMNKAKNLVRDN